MTASFTLAEARALLPELRRREAVIVELRADLADARLALGRGDEPRGGLAQVKALEAHLQEAVDWFAASGVQLKGIAPLIADFPGELGGEPVLLCWLEGEASLAWYHRPDSGFLGRRRLPTGR
jgi:hypothetical protein